MLKEIVGQEKIYEDSDSDDDYNEIKYERESNLRRPQIECMFK